MWYCDYNTVQVLPIALLTSAGAAITGAAPGDVTFTYKKKGASAWTPKTLDAASWSEVGSGIYNVTFTSSEMNTYGLFMFRAVHANGYGVGFATITDYATEADQLQKIYDMLALKVNKSAILEREKELDNQLQFMAATQRANTDDIVQLNIEINALKKRIAAL